MNKTRLEAFSDGVLAIIITIMVLEIKVPEGDTFDALLKLYPIFLSYVLSFIYLGIYWNNHHHMLQSASKINGKILWANLHLLFWLSLVPITTGWMGENHFAKATMTLYGIVLFMAAIAYTILQYQVTASKENNILAKALGKDIKGKISPILYLTGIAFSFYNGWVSGAMYILVALIWLVPDKRIERTISAEKE
ncbi:TMEM175 family protein [Flavobacterium sp. GT3R68]|uniref:TMEM175 family protein n=1 Tax=Flavobacterium sp. GT3R68 TaxID=2594437 RepID=UPI000F872552|nr:TMEM175 family protein [Flavobacterium sp. GT3R68]RTY94922.1 DUF1211 domain-containing protein [Flavobacterium sp. GSN2]TRW91726.1 DUF1211 domain-containing protein [Flavobacterium sp. GT3R68]